MGIRTNALLIATRRVACLLCSALVIAGVEAGAQNICPAPVLASGLNSPLGVTQSPLGNLIVSETGTATLHSGRISIVDLNGQRRTLLSGLPSSRNDVGDPSGPAGIFLRGRTLYLLIGVGDVGLPGPVPATSAANPNPSSPLFSSVLAIHFSADVEQHTEGVTLTVADQNALAGGQKITLGSGGDAVSIEMIANLPNYIANPLPSFQGNVRLSNPFGVVAVGNDLFVTDGGRNLVWRVDVPSGALSVVTNFPQVPNPVAPFGPPLIDAVPTGIAYDDGQLLVTLFRGFPFPPGVSAVVDVDPVTGTVTPLVSGLKTAIGVVPLRYGDLFVLQHISGPPGPPPLAGPGSLTYFPSPSGPSTVVANCLSRPTAMTLDERSRTMYITELVTGRLVAISVEP